jgi:hypothetical protein
MGPVPPPSPHPHIHKVASETTYAKTTLHRSPSSSVIYKLLLVDKSVATGSSKHGDLFGYLLRYSVAFPS